LPKQKIQNMGATLTTPKILRLAAIAAIVSFVFSPARHAVAQATPETVGILKTASAPVRFELGLGYSYMHADDAVVQNITSITIYSGPSGATTSYFQPIMVRVPQHLSGFTVSGFYNVNSWFALGGEVSDLYGSENQPFTSTTPFNDNVSLDRYLYLFGPQVTLQPGERVKVVGHLLAGGVSDRMRVSSPNGTTPGAGGSVQVTASFPVGPSYLSADAFALDAGVGVDFQVTRHFSVGPTFDYVLTHLPSYTGNWQNNWRAGLTGKFSF
jgi:hypothetical protein